ncbi:cytochrome c oxidase subunit II [Nocardioides gansuensis]|uniref:cytochrome-c oxidase n=2 Tax=Nocardioides gansuensis TaxID=2138300 RepID=A0A2T8FAJ1_9ACTN|nr:cytochrome c oxidase subunit II [Nocardioides gansuensis]
MLGFFALTVAACGDAADKDQIARLAMPDPATEQAPATFELWKWAWVAAMITGVIVWGLIFWAIWRYRRRSDDEVPIQTRYNLPLEIFYTIAPIMMVVVFFYWTVDVQNKMTHMEDDPDITIDVVGQKWQWTFNYTGQGEGGSTPYTVGTGSQRPTLVLPVDQTVQFNLQSPDVIHSFGIDAFLMKMDVVPGRINQFQATPTVVGDYNGKCFELCGTYHSRMLFDVKIVDQADYDAYLADLAAQGFEAEEPLLGGEAARTQHGLAEDDSQEGAHE